MSINVGYEVMGLDSSPAYGEISKVVIFLNETTYLESGDDSGATLECFSPFATQAIADDLLARVSHFQYQPFNATGAFIDPAAEVGDDINAGTVSSAIFSIDYNFGSLFTADIEAPTTREIDHEYPYEPKSDREFKRTVGEIGSSITQTVDMIRKEITDRTQADKDMSSLIEQTVEDVVIEFNLNDVKAYFKFTSNGLEIGKTGSPFSVVLSESELGFYENGVKVAYANNEQFFMPYGVVQNKLDVGGYQLDATDGIKFRWKGREN